MDETKSGSCAFQIGVEEEGPGSRKKRRRQCFELRVKILSDSNSVVGIQPSVVSAGGSRNIQEEPDNVGRDGLSKRKPFFTGAEAVQHAAIIAEAEGISQIEATRLERILPQLLLDF